MARRWPAGAALANAPRLRPRVRLAFPHEPGHNARIGGEAVATYVRSLCSPLTTPFRPRIAGDAQAISSAQDLRVSSVTRQGALLDCHSGWRSHESAFHDQHRLVERRSRRGAVLELESRSNAFTRRRSCAKPASPAPYCIRLLSPGKTPPAGRGSCSLSARRSSTTPADLSPDLAAQSQFLSIPERAARERVPRHAHLGRSVAAGSPAGGVPRCFPARRSRPPPCPQGTQGFSQPISAREGRRPIRIVTRHAHAISGYSDPKLIRTPARRKPGETV